MDIVFISNLAGSLKFGVSAFLFLTYWYKIRRARIFTKYRRDSFPPSRTHFCCSVICNVFAMQCNKIRFLDLLYCKSLYNAKNGHKLTWNCETPLTYVSRPDLLDISKHEMMKFCRTYKMHWFFQFESIALVSEWNFRTHGTTEALRVVCVCFFFESF